ncbi:MAG: Retroviral aspartyl protease [Chloroflexi bacterium]|nr:Retroviral aspartyl protease [Chloroflexota bacterium]MBI4288066.1 Retroviral aspartyl protease [Chloroflexota bacterium]
MRAKNMGTFTVSVQVADPQRRQFVEVEAPVDTGASHIVLPRAVLRGLAIEAVGRVSFQLADERVVDYEVGEARIRSDGRERTTLVVFGPEGATPLLAVTTLDLFNMDADPVKRRLAPVPALLKKDSTV